MIHKNKRVTGLCDGQAFTAQVECCKTRILEITFVHLFFQTLEEKIVVPIRHLQMSMEPFRQLCGQNRAMILDDQATFQARQLSDKFSYFFRIELFIRMKLALQRVGIPVMGDRMKFGLKQQRQAFCSFALAPPFPWPRSTRADWSRA